MRKIFKFVYNKMKNLRSFFKNHETVFAEDEDVKQMFGDVISNTEQVGILFGEQELKSQPFILARNECRIKLEGIVSTIRGFLISYGFRNNFKPFMGEEGTSWYQIQRMANQELLTYAMHLKQLAEQHSSEGGAAGVTSEVFAELDSCRLAFVDSVSATQNYRKDRKEVTAKITDLIEGFVKTEQNVITPYMTSKYSQSHPEVFADYLKALDVPSIRTNQMSLIGQIVDADSGEPIGSVSISVDEKKPERKGGKSGGFRFAYLSPGVHELTFDKEGYVGTSSRILILQGQSTRIDVKLKKISVAQEVEGGS
ncbi:MAG: carboxypeptidase-like regulatory domain-containing protein [Marinifilaceae bacterium]